MSCALCHNISDVDPKSGPYVIRICSQCGREMRTREIGKHGIGINVKEGEQFVIPAEWLITSANPLKGNGNFTRSGLSWFAKLIFLSELPRSVDEFKVVLDSNEKYCSEVLKRSVHLKGLDIEKESDMEIAFDIIRKLEGTAEWYAMAFGSFNAIALSAIEEGDANKAAWAMSFAERMRSMCVFKENLEEVVWIGHSAGRKIVKLLKLWDANRDNGDEGFWQIHFNENPYVLSQLLSVPVVFIRDNAYVGGMTVDRKDARLVDYLFSGDLSNEAILIEIKAPTTPLLGPKYRRQIYRPSSEIAGSVVQIMDYRHSLISNLTAITSGLERPVNAFNPRCLVIAGDGGRQLVEPSKRHSFEIFRTSLQGIELITYDELFKKLEILASLFNIKRAQTEK